MLGEAVEDATHLGYFFEADSARLVVEAERVTLLGEEFIEPVEWHLVAGDTGGLGHVVMMPKGCGTDRERDGAGQ